jgi:hypothetical protein
LRIHVGVGDGQLLFGEPGNLPEISSAQVRPAKIRTSEVGPY